jgi:hypothetical protein
MKMSETVKRNGVGPREVIDMKPLIVDSALLIGPILGFLVAKRAFFSECIWRRQSDSSFQAASGTPRLSNLCY